MQLLLNQGTSQLDYSIEGVKHRLGQRIGAVEGAQVDQASSRSGLEQIRQFSSVTVSAVLRSLRRMIAQLLVGAPRFLHVVSKIEALKLAISILWPTSP